MRLGLIIYGSLDSLSGGYLYDRNLVTHLRTQGDSVEIISLPWRNYLLHLKDNFSSRLFHSLVDLQVDLLLQDELNHPSLFMLNYRLRKQISYPIISIVHHLRSEEAFPKWQSRIYCLIERRYLSSADGFICNCRTTQRMVVDLIDDSKIQNCPSLIAYPGGNRFHPQISEAEISKRSHQEGAIRLLFLGNIIPRKGLHVLLKALKRLSSDQFILNVVGNPEMDPSYFQAIRRQVKRYGLANQVHFCGILGDNDLVSCMKASHLLVMPSFYEAYGIVYLEGMGFGLPAIGTYNGGAKEIITSGADGFLISPGDDATLAKYIVRLANNREQLLKMSLVALDNYNSRPNWEDSMKSIHTFLKELVQ
jgi:glycosyltransferase involved in cell wall biosynthesis